MMPRNCLFGHALVLAQHAFRPLLCSCPEGKNGSFSCSWFFCRTKTRSQGPRRRQQRQWRWGNTVATTVDKSAAMSPRKGEDRHSGCTGIAVYLYFVLQAPHMHKVAEVVGTCGTTDGYECDDVLPLDEGSVRLAKIVVILSK